MSSPTGPGGQAEPELRGIEQTLGLLNDQLVEVADKLSNHMHHLLGAEPPAVHGNETAVDHPADVCWTESIRVHLHTADWQVRRIRDQVERLGGILP